MSAITEASPTTRSLGPIHANHPNMSKKWCFGTFDPLTIGLTRVKGFKVVRDGKQIHFGLFYPCFGRLEHNPGPPTRVLSRLTPPFSMRKSMFPPVIDSPSLLEPCEPPFRPSERIGQRPTRIILNFKVITLIDGDCPTKKGTYLSLLVRICLRQLKQLVVKCSHIIAQSSSHPREET